jgi:oligoribonuclease
MDLEMSGLDPDRCVILEIATVVTDEDLNVVAEGPDLVVHQDEAALESLSEWSREHFGASGLLDRVRASEVSVAEAERRTLAFLRRHCKARMSPLCGNSVHMDRHFLWRGMRALHDFLHYRNVDVSTVKELLRRWYPADFAPPPKTERHVALLDVRESIEELRYYRDRFLPARPPPAP